MSVLAAAAISAVMAFDQPEVDGKWWDPSVNVKHRIVKPKLPPTIPIWNPRAEPDAPPPSAHDPEPLYCRVEAPFPNTDDCIVPTDPPAPADDDPEITPGDVLEEVKRIGLPRLTVTVQPPGSTLVNLETIFHTTATDFERTVTILDSTVTVRATPATYTWHHGDGTTQTTRNPGRPYPALDIIHRYQQPGKTHTHVNVTYQVTYQIDDQPWQQLDTTITATGPATALRIREARPVLTH